MKKIKKSGIIGLITIIGFIFISCSDLENPVTRLPALTGTVSISGTAQVGQTLTAITTNLGGSGLITFQWQRSGNVIGSNNSTYTVQPTDIDSTISVTVTRSDNSGSITSNPTAPVVSLTTVTFNNVTANGSETQTTTQLTLTFSQAITGLTANDITLSGISGVQKGFLSNSGSTYTLPISGFSVGGTLSVSVAKTGHIFSGNPKQVSVHYAIPTSFNNLTANGSATLSTTTLTLTFNRDIIGFNIDDIEIIPNDAGVAKGSLARTGTGIYNLTLSNVSESGQISVSVSKAGYSISNGIRIVSVFAVGNSLLNITFNQIIDEAPNIIGPTLYRITNGGPTSATLSVDNPSQYSSINWRVQNTTVTGTGSSFTLNAANPAYNLIGEHFVTVSVIWNGVPYNKTVSFFIAY